MRSGVEKVVLTGGVQAAIQACGFLGGLVAIWLLPVQEYAYYTIANAVLGTMTVLADSGVAQSVLAQGGKVWQDSQALGGVVAGGMALRRRFAAFALLVSLPILYYLLHQHG